MARTIYYLQTQWNTYDQRHDLFNTGVRWDSLHRRWWSTRKAAVNRAQRVLGNGEVVRAEVVKLPKVAATHRGGRPRAPRGSRKLALAQAAAAHQPSQRANLTVMKAESATQPARIADDLLVAVGGPIVRRDGNANADRRAGVEDRRRGDRRGDNRPAAVMLIPMMEDGAKLAG
jgi:hypothetical protein